MLYEVITVDAIHDGRDGQAHEAQGELEQPIGAHQDNGHENPGKDFLEPDPAAAAQRTPLPP